MEDEIGEMDKYICPKCGHIDDMDQATGFWEKGVDEAGNDLFDCPNCNQRVNVQPAPLVQRIKDLEAALMVYGFTLEYVLQLKDDSEAFKFTATHIAAARACYLSVMGEEPITR